MAAHAPLTWSVKGLIRADCMKAAHTYTQLMPAKKFGNHWLALDQIPLHGRRINTDKSGEINKALTNYNVNEV